MSARTYLTVAEVVAIEQELIERYGGAPGLRDPGALEAAMFRPQTGHYEDVVAEAAALFESLVMSHPFMDGNKRVAFAAADVFSRLNGFRITGSSSSIHAEMMKMFDTGTLDIEHLKIWLKRIMKRAK